MIKLHARLEKRLDAEPFVARVARGRGGGRGDLREVQFVDGQDEPSPGYGGYLLAEGLEEGPWAARPDAWPIPEALGHLSDGDVVRISPRSGELWVMYRRGSTSNSMLLTERCNSYCVMCSQPPRDVADDHLVRSYLEAIPLMSRETNELGITGGEPTLLGDRLLEIIRKCRDHLPETSLHMLSNGRMFNYLSLSREVAEIGHPDLMIGVPLYSDLPHRHDFVVQADGAFDQTIRGLMNLARCGVSVEIRVVLHRQTVERLPQLARFIARNLPFADHVALMGLEMMGFVRMNLEPLWIDPADYRPQLTGAVEHLHRRGMNVSIYNHQLCVLDRGLWPFARKSISDWKNEYVDECVACAARDHCGGFFASSSLRRSSRIRPLTPDMIPPESATSPTLSATP
ncbi:His-Xaa-Ser system radical SAM maturase HxsC [Paludisphaera soli]|uniref:His-Xaa-Ser system radical SAM maturase HxsC n=1 Tax=Paludisphaera soli TaxID=2712865 RepID=UPI00197E0D0C|nr:His-Xaa-Ser system radical SAM maturase HxsC [Paludisphaera soli]